MLHAFYFPDVAFDDGNLFKKILIGLFEPRFGFVWLVAFFFCLKTILKRNVEEVHQNPRDLAGSGIRFGELSERDCIIHDSGAYSPANCQLRRIVGADMYSFWIVATDKETGVSVVSFHLICGSEEAESKLKSIAASSKAISDLLIFDPLAAEVIKRAFL